MQNDPTYSFAALRNRLSVSGLLVAETALRVGAGRDIKVMGNDLPVLRDARGRPIIPGASLKGVFRARMEALVRAVRLDQARDLNQIEAQAQALTRWRNEDPQLQELRRQRQVVELDRRYAQEAVRISTLIDLTFGAPWLAGRVFFRDALVDDTLWFGQYEIRNGVAIDRDTETVSDSKLYDYEVVPAGTRFVFSLTAENLNDWQLGMLLLGLEPWRHGEVQIGGFRSRGLGHVRLRGPEDQDELAVSFVEVRDVEDVLALLGDPQAPRPVRKEQRDAWVAAFKRELTPPQQSGKEPSHA